MMRVSLRMWGGEKIENEIERLVKILTKCKMKLKSRRRRDKMKLWNRVGRGHGVTSLHFAYPFPRFAPPSTTSFHSLFSPTNLPPPPFHLASRHVPSSRSSSYPHSSCSALPSSFIKITEAAERKRGGGVVPSLLAQLASPSVEAPSSPAGPCPPGGRYRLRF